jgi:hypothetical protein
VEATNKTLVRTLKKKLEKKKGAWVEYVLEVLWSYRITRRTPTGETPFSLTYGTEAVIPAEVGSPSFCVAYYNPGLNYRKKETMLKLHGQHIRIEQLSTSINWWFLKSFRSEIGYLGK